MPEENVGPENQGSQSGDSGTQDVTQAEHTTEYKLEQWREAIPEDLATHTSLSDIKDVEGLAKGYIHAQKLIGQDKVALPREDWTDSDWDTFYEKIGRPEDSTGYNFETPEDAPEGWNPNEDFVDDLAKLAHKQGLNKKQAEELYNFMQRRSIDTHSKSMADYQQKVQNDFTELKTEWGTAYDQNIQLANKIVSLGGERFAKWLKDSGAGQQTELIRLAAKVGRMLSEDKIGDTGQRQKYVPTPVEAKTKINKIMGDKEHPYHDNRHPAHQDAVRDVAKLHEFAYPEEG